MESLTVPRGRSRMFALLTLALAAVLGFTLTTPASAAQAVVYNLGPAQVFISIYWYPTQHIKPTTGTAFLKVTQNTETCGGGGVVRVGMRPHSAPGGELTQYPWIAVNQTVQYRNVSAPPAVQYTFNAGSYWMEAQLGCSAATWSGKLTL